MYLKWTDKCYQTCCLTRPKRFIPSAQYQAIKQWVNFFLFFVTQYWYYSLPYTPTLNTAFSLLLKTTTCTGVWLWNITLQILMDYTCKCFTLSNRLTLTETCKPTFRDTLNKAELQNAVSMSANKCVCKRPLISANQGSAYQTKSDQSKYQSHRPRTWLDLWGHQFCFSTVMSFIKCSNSHTHLISSG